MQASALQLDHYFVTDVAITANKKFDFKKPMQLNFEHLSAEPTFIQDKKKEDHWQVSLRLKFQPSPDVNVPYHFALGITGFFRVHKKCEFKMRDCLILVNAPSLLYGAAREIIRSLMSNGPYPALLLPTVSFVSNAKEALPTAAETAKANAGAPENPAAKAPPATV